MSLMLSIIILNISWERKMTDTEVKMLFYFLFFIPGIIALLLFTWKAYNLSSQKDKTFFGIKAYKINFLSDVFPLIWLNTYLTWVWIMRDRDVYTNVAIANAACIYIYCAINVILFLKKDSLEKRKTFTSNLRVLTCIYFLISLLTE